MLSSAAMLRDGTRPVKPAAVRLSSNVYFLSTADPRLDFVARTGGGDIEPADIGPGMRVARS
jgi:hypothetical protein